MYNYKEYIYKMNSNDLDKEPIIAHRDTETGKEQLLLTHLLKTAKLAVKKARDIKLYYTAYLLGVLHDIGKADSLFQNKIKNNTSAKVNHSSAGAKFVYEIYKGMERSYKSEDITFEKQYPQSFVEIIMYVIEAHHGIFDIIDRDDEQRRNVAKIFERIKYDEESKDYNYNQVKEFAYKELEPKLTLDNNKVDFKFLFEKAFEEHRNISNKLKKVYSTETDMKKHEMKFYKAMEIRLLLAILKSADILDTINAYEDIIEPISENDKAKIVDNYVKAVENMYGNYNTNKDNANEINRVRNIIAEKTLERGTKDSEGVYKLDVPTGAGKTKASLRYAVHQMQKNKRSRIFYITAFLSVLEQNAFEIRDILKDKGILEHHSNVINTNEYNTDENLQESKENMKLQYLTGSWDENVVLSTMVQFFNTLLKGKSDNIRRFASLINSVIILDEVQSLPIEVTYFFNLIMNFLARVMKCNVILCTATQPIYDSEHIKHKLVYGGVNFEEEDIVKLNENDYKVFERAEVFKLKTGDNFVELDEIVEKTVDLSKQSQLLVFNTKAVVKEVYNRLSKRGIDCFYLSTNLCAEHRKNIIKEIKKRLNEEINSQGQLISDANNAVICVSTQLIEAGVDVDFSNIIRSYAGVDSLIQIAGRCNREGKRVGGNVFLVDLKNDIEKVQYLKGIKEKKDITRFILGKLSQNKVDLNKFSKEFFQSYFANSEESKLKYPFENGTLFDYMIGNIPTNSGNKDLKEKKLKNRIKTVADEFELIDDDNSRGVIVYYGDSGNKIENLIEEINNYRYDKESLNKIKKLLRELQPYTVNINKNNNKLSGAIQKYMNDSIWILTKEFYDEKLGIKEEEDSLLML